jgi:hypothetical protein
MSKKKVVAKREHKLGKNCGYDINERGEIFVAPNYSDEMDRCLEETRAIKEIVAQVTRTTSAMMAAIKRREQSCWKRMIDDYGLLDGAYSYHFAEGKLSPKPADEEQSQ